MQQAAIAKALQIKNLTMKVGNKNMKRKSKSKQKAKKAREL